MSKIPNFWDGDHPNNHLAKEFESLMPPTGAANTVEGEMYRAASRLVYDFYNNGFCNDNSGPLEFLSEFNLVTDKQYKTLEPYMWGARYGEPGIFDNDELVEAVNEVCNQVLCHIRNKNGNYEDNIDPSSQPYYDMFDWRRPEPAEYKIEDDEFEEEYDW